jgi:transcription antitermination factor NusG
VLFRLNDVSSLAGCDWNAIEFSDNMPVVARIVRRLPTLFGSSPVELFVPVERRDLDVHTLSSPFLYVRSANHRALLKIKSINGVGGLATLGDTGSIYDVLSVPDSHVQILILQAEAAFYAPSAGVRLGDFVRILNGLLKNFCGHVTALEHHRAEVRVVMMTKSVTISTPRSNLLRLDAPPDRQTFYYSPLVADLDLNLIAPDLQLHPDESLPEISSSLLKVRGPRDRTMTALLRSLLRTGERDWIKLAEACVQGMVNGEVTPVASFVAFRTTLQGCILEALRPEGRGNYEEWFEEHPSYRLDRGALLVILAPLNLPNTNHGVRPGRKNRKASA